MKHRTETHTRNVAKETEDHQETSRRSKPPKNYLKTGPYRHIVIPSLVNDDLLRKVRQELLAIHATRKETDIYRVFQTGDMANLNGLPEEELGQLKSLLELRNALYSDEFRDFVAKMCGTGKLSPSKADLSHNITSKVRTWFFIGTRAISYIIYLTDPEHPWSHEDGGGLELYPVISKGTPAIHPTVIIPPAWNQMAMFAVQPGHSFHSVAEVVAVDRVRPSILLCIPRMALNQQLVFTLLLRMVPFKKSEVMRSDEENGDDEEEDTPLTDEEIAFLKPFVNPVYFKPAIIAQANERFCDESSIQVASFLEPSLAAALTASTIHVDEKDGLLLKKPRSAKQPAPIANYELGITETWTPTGPSHKHRFLELHHPLPQPATPIKSKMDPSTDLAAIQNTLFQSKPILRFIHLITSLRATKLRSQIRRFRPGMDYTLATTSSFNADLGVLDATLTFVCQRTKQDADAWESDEVGGFDCYMVPDESNDDPSQYCARGRKVPYGVLQLSSPD
ncbi:UNVERIFIED_CONTAM: hypothetical protein HDU68_005032 [Siphonaria sp. JEL0065]|nr:hypothetical protein HDU68_005032 [Siphonaria sp. JEL0065]